MTEWGAPSRIVISSFIICLETARISVWKFCTKFLNFWIQITCRNFLLETEMNLLFKKVYRIRMENFSYENVDLYNVNEKIFFSLIRICWIVFCNHELSVMFKNLVDIYIKKSCLLLIFSFLTKIIIYVLFSKCYLWWTSYENVDFFYIVN